MSDWTEAALVRAVHEYFRGERREMRLIVVATVVTLCAASAVWWGLRDAFWRGLAVTLAVVMALFGAAAADLLVRDPRVEGSLIEGLKGPQAAAHQARERERIEQVTRQYPAYRAGGAVAVLLGLLVLWWSRQPWACGLAAGLCLGFVVLLVIDHFSAQRAGRYLQALASPA